MHAPMILHLTLLFSVGVSHYDVGFFLLLYPLFQLKTKRVVPKNIVTMTCRTLYTFYTNTIII